MFDGNCVTEPDRGVTMTLCKECYLFLVALVGVYNDSAESDSFFQKYSTVLECRLMYPIYDAFLFSLIRFSNI